MADAGGAYDLIIIGGGINGAGIAHDAAMRRFRVLLLEARDFGGATSAWSTRLIHGGLRYLEYAEIGLVQESLRERRRLLANAAHLVKPLRLTIPVYRGGRRGRALIRLGMLAYDLLSWGKALPAHRMLSREQLLEAEPGINAEGLLGGAQYYDAQVTFIERLVLEIVLAASRQGAEVHNYSPVTGIECRDDGPHRVRYRGRDGVERAAAAAVVVNAAGPWVDRVLGLGDEPLPRLMGGTKGSHIVVGAFRGAPANALYVEARADGRPIFVVPWNQQYLIGTTDIRVEGDPADAAASDEEIAYLVGETNRLFPKAELKSEEIHFAYAGVRPLPYQRKGPESAITRRHIIKRHRGRANGLLSIIGGKLTTYRSLAEQTVNIAADHLQRRAGTSPTRTALLPGAEAYGAAEAAAGALGALSASGRRRLVDVYGGRVQRLCEMINAEPQLGEALDEDGTVLAAEVALAAREEFACELSDFVHRRLMIGLSAKTSAQNAAAVAAIAATELGWDSEETQRQLERLNAHNAKLRRAP